MWPGVEKHNKIDFKGDYWCLWASQGVLVVKNLHANAGDLLKRRGFDPWVRKTPGGGHGSLFQHPCLENPHGQRRLEGYSPQCCTESDMTTATWHAQNRTRLQRLSMHKLEITIRIKEALKGLPWC